MYFKSRHTLRNKGGAAVKNYHLTDGLKTKPGVAADPLPLLKINPGIK